MDRTVSSLRQLRSSCPFLSRTPMPQLRSMTTTTILPGGPTRLAVRAQQCPVMSEAIAEHPNEAAAAAPAMSSAAGNFIYSSGPQTVAASHLFVANKRPAASAAAPLVCPFAAGATHNPHLQQARTYVSRTEAPAASVVATDHLDRIHAKEGVRTGGHGDIEKCPHTKVSNWLYAPICAVCGSGMLT